MRKAYKIIIACACVAFVFVLLVFGFGKRADTAHSNQNSNADNTQIESGSRKIRLQDGSEVILMNPSVLGDDFDWDRVDFELTGDHE